MLQPRVRDFATILITQIRASAGKLREADSVLKPRARDLVETIEVQAGELREFKGN